MYTTNIIPKSSKFPNLTDVKNEEILFISKEARFATKELKILEL